MVRYFYMKTTFYILIFTGFLKGIFISGGNGLKWVRVNVPQYRVPGETAQLQCDYDLGNDTLYSVKWYKEQEEFYRFVPKSSPSANSYEVDGVRVDMSKSNSKKVVLHSVDWRTSGLFRCEVSAEAPSFASAQSEARMEIVSLPIEDPMISGVEDQYRIGEKINLNCTSGRSRPVSSLLWYVNEQQINKETVIIHYPIVQHSKGLLSKTLGLSFVLDNRHFLGGSMKIKCISTITPVLFGDNDDDDDDDDDGNNNNGDDSMERISQNIPNVKDTRQALLLVRSIQSSGGHHPTNWWSCFLSIFWFNIICQSKLLFDFK